MNFLTEASQNVRIYLFTQKIYVLKNYTYSKTKCRKNFESENILTFAVTYVYQVSDNLTVNKKVNLETRWPS